MRANIDLLNLLFFTSCKTVITACCGAGPIAVVQLLLTDSLQPHGLQLARVPGVRSNSCPLSR